MIPLPFIISIPSASVTWVPAEELSTSQLRPVGEHVDGNSLTSNELRMAVELYRVFPRPTLKKLCKRVVAHDAGYLRNAREIGPEEDE